MTDSCKCCTVKGDYRACINQDCFVHKSWFAQEQTTIILELSQIISALSQTINQAYAEDSED